jgi:hypothetical protein
MLTIKVEAFLDHSLLSVVGFQEAMTQPNFSLEQFAVDTAMKGIANTHCRHLKNLRALRNAWRGAGAVDGDRDHQRIAVELNELVKAQTSAHCLVMPLISVGHERRGGQRIRDSD